MSERIRNRHRTRSGSLNNSVKNVLGMQSFMNHSISLQKLSDKYVGPYGDVQLLQSFMSQNDLGSFVNGTMLEKIPPGSLVIDCGAFIGDSALDFQRYGWKVIAFEPYWDNYVCLVHNSPKSINIMSPVGDGSLVKLDHVCPGENHGMRQLFNDQGGVHSTRIDDLPLSQKVSLIKIDVEGMEYAVIDGAIETIKRDSPMLHVEVFPEKLNNHGISVENLDEKLKSLGYGMIALGSGNVKWDVICSKEISIHSTIYPSS